MKLIKVTMVRIYITEASKLLRPIITYLQKEQQIRGITVLRAICGYGETGAHLAALVDLSLNLPLTIEFFDRPEKIKMVLQYLHTLVKSEHVVFWDVETYDYDN